ncbi:MAG: hypothetical protein AAB568_00635 [Patescibacteria group bacterium]
MNRKTDLTLEVIMKELRTQDGCHNCGTGYPACLLANEVGVMAVSGDIAAEAFLCELMLCHDEMNLKAISYSYLKKNLPAKQPGTEEAIKVFVADPQNAPIINMVEKKEAEKQEEIRHMADLADKHLPGNS